MKTLEKIPATRAHEVSIIPFGGCGEFGMNLTSYLLREEHYVVDCGIMFPDPTLLGVDAIMPEVDKFFATAGGVSAYFITHGHEDHVGGLPFLHQKWPAPVYATAWTALIIRERFKNLGLNPPKVRLVQAGDRVAAGSIEVEWIHVNHSIPMACALLIKTGEARIFHTGDFKFDAKPIGDPPMDAKLLNRLGNKGIDVLVADSTNAISPGMCPSESSTIASLGKLVASATGACYITTFSSNFWRLKILLDIAKRLKKKVFFAGQGLHRTLEFARELNMMEPYEEILINEKILEKTPKNRLLVVLTGCQGEPMSALGRIVRDEHKHLSLGHGDRLIFSSRIIPGSERAVFNIVANCEKAGVEVFTTKSHPDIHVSGHAYEGDLRKLIKNLRPKYFLPVHGTFTHIGANRALAKACGIAPERTYLVEDGCVFSLKAKSLKLRGKLAVSRRYIDGFSKHTMELPTLKQRLRIGELGCVLVTGVLSRKSKKWIADPAMTLLGLAVPVEEEQQTTFYDACLAVIKESVIQHMNDKPDDLDEAVRLVVRRHLFPYYKKKIVVVARMAVV